MNDASAHGRSPTGEGRAERAPATVQWQLIDRRRGGYCFEHTQLFAVVLEDLGFDVRRRLGRVGGPASTRTHRTVEVRLGEDRYRADPGFGLGITGPLSLAPGASRQEPGGEYTIRHETMSGIDHWSLLRNGAVEHTVDALPVQPIDVRSSTSISTMTRTGCARSSRRCGRTERSPGSEGPRLSRAGPAGGLLAVVDMR